MGEFRLLWMKTTMTILSSNELPITNLTLKRENPCPDLPIDVLPRYVFLFHELDKSIHVPVSVCYVLSNYRSMEINENLSFRTHHPFSLIISKQLITVDTSEKCVFSIVGESFKFFHIDLACKFIFSISQVDQFIHCDCLGDFLDQVRI